MTELWQLSGAEIANLVACRAVSATEVTEAHLARLEAANPSLNAVVHEFPEEALAAAADIDAQIARGEDPGPLGGVPVTTKVTTDQKGQATTGGLTLAQDAIATRDSPVIANIRKAGGIIVGRTATPAFSVRWFTKSRLYGQTLNPHDADLTPGGSSGGASASVAAGLCAVAHGTDIAGSIRYPAYACGLQGLRPSFGRVPQVNVGAERMLGGQLMAVSGPIARSVADIELSLKAMSAPDPRDPWWVPAPLSGPDFAKRAVLARAPDGMVVAAEVISALDRAAACLRDTGWTVEETPCPPLRPAAEINLSLWMSDFRCGMQDMVEREGDEDASFVIGQLCKRAPATDLCAVQEALKARAGLIRQWALFFEDHAVLLCPVSGQLPFRQQADVEGEAAFAAVLEAQMTLCATPALGLPGLSVAMGSVGTAPVGIQLVAGRFREDILLAAGADIERSAPPVRVVDPQ